MESKYVSIRLANLDKFNINIDAIQWAIDNAPAQYTSTLIDTKHIIIELRQNAKVDLQNNDGAEPTEICPKCSSEVITNKPTGSKFCVQCDYEVASKLRYY